MGRGGSSRRLTSANTSASSATTSHRDALKLTRRSSVTRALARGAAASSSVRSAQKKTCVRAGSYATSDAMMRSTREKSDGAWDRREGLDDAAKGWGVRGWRQSRCRNVQVALLTLQLLARDHVAWASSSAACSRCDARCMHAHGRRGACASLCCNLTQELRDKNQRCKCWESPNPRPTPARCSRRGSVAQTTNTRPATATRPTLARRSPARCCCGCSAHAAPNPLPPHPQRNET